MPHRKIAKKIKEWFTTGGMLDLRRQLVGFACLMLMWIVTQYFDRSFFEYLTGIPAAIIIAITSLVRGHDMRKDDWDYKSVIRRLAFLMAVVASVRYGTRLWTRPGDYPDWGVVVGLWAWALTLFTTPNMPPWWKYIHVDPVTEPDGTIVVPPTQEDIEDESN